MPALPRSPGRARVVALAVPALILACTISSTLAALNDNTVKGAATNHIFSSAFGDSIDALSGQLTFNIPIGPSFAVSDRLNYQLQLFYTSKVLRYDSDLLTDRNLVIDGRGQAGVGFYLQLGRLYWKWPPKGACLTSGDDRSLVMQFADGAEHEVSFQGIPGVASDLSFVKATPIWAAPPQQTTLLGYEVRTPDGIIYRMDHWVDDPNTYSDANATPGSCNVDGHPHIARMSEVRGWYVSQISEQGTSATISVTYDDPNSRMNHLIKSITDSTGRTIGFRNVPTDPNVGIGTSHLNLGYVTEVRLPSFGVADPSSSNAAVYSFQYETTRPTDDIVRPELPSDPNIHLLWPDVFLKKVIFPAIGPAPAGSVCSAAASMQYETSFGYLDHGNGRHVGVVTTRTLPTGAEIQYGYGNYGFAMSATIGNPVCPPPTGFMNPDPPLGVFEPRCPPQGAGAYLASTTAGVNWKKVRRNPDSAEPFNLTNLTLRVAEDNWTWNRDFTQDPVHGSALSNPYKVIETDMFQNHTVHYFAASNGPDPNPDPNTNSDPDYVNSWKDGLPLATQY